MRAAVTGNGWNGKESGTECARIVLNSGATDSSRRDSNQTDFVPGMAHPPPMSHHKKNPLPSSQKRDHSVRI